MLLHTFLISIHLPSLNFTINLYDFKYNFYLGDYFVLNNSKPFPSSQPSMQTLTSCYNTSLNFHKYYTSKNNLLFFIFFLLFIKLSLRIISPPPNNSALFHNSPYTNIWKLNILNIMSINHRLTSYQYQLIL